MNLILRALQILKKRGRLDSQILMDEMGIDFEKSSEIMNLLEKCEINLPILCNGFNEEVKLAIPAKDFIQLDWIITNLRQHESFFLENENFLLYSYFFDYPLEQRPNVLRRSSVTIYNSKERREDIQERRSSRSYRTRKATGHKGSAKRSRENSIEKILHGSTYSSIEDDNKRSKLE